MNLKSMRPKFAAIVNVLILLWLSSLGSAFSETPAPAALPPSSSLSPDKQWEYKCAEYGLGQCAPEIVKAGTTQVVLDLADLPSGSDANQAEVFWAPDSTWTCSCIAEPEHTSAVRRRD